MSSWWICLYWWFSNLHLNTVNKSLCLKLTPDTETCAPSLQAAAGGAGGRCFPVCSFRFGPSAPSRAAGQNSSHPSGTDAQRSHHCPPARLRPPCAEMFPEVGSSVSSTETEADSACVCGRGRCAAARLSVCCITGDVGNKSSPNCLYVLVLDWALIPFHSTVLD